MPYTSLERFIYINKISISYSSLDSPSQRL